MSNRTSQADRKGKGKAFAMPKHFRKPSVRIIDGQEGVSLETISLQDTLQAEAMYSCGENSVTLQKVLRTDLMFQDGEFTDLPLHIKLLLDNLQAAFTLKQKDLFQKTLQVLELHLVNTGAFIEALGCQLPGKEDGDSSSTKTGSQSLKSYLMGTSFSKLHPKIQQKTRLAIKNLLPKIQQKILIHTALTSSYDRWMYLFKVFVSTAFIRTEDMTGEIWLSNKATWYESFGDVDRVYERTGDRYDPYPGLLINTEIEDPVICDPLWLSEMLEAGFISKLVITSANQISLFPKVIQEAAAQIGGLNYMKMEIWSTLLVWDTSYYMESQPAHILVLIHDWGFIPEYNWYSGDTYLSLDDPSALAQEWSNFKCKKIYEVQKDLDRDFHLYGYTDRIAVYGPRPSARRLIGKRRIVKDPRLMTTKDHVPVFILISYCALCNDYGVPHEHE
nr:hypothetical protein CFP56_17637 [Quercus suber]